jgi:lipoprotein LpqH
MTPPYPLEKFGIGSDSPRMYLPHDDATGAAAKEKDKHMTKNRVLAAGIGILATAAVLVGCSDDKGNEPAASSSGDGSTTAQVASGGSTEVKVEGQDLAGLDLKSVTCVKAGGKINVASAAVGGQQGLGVVMTDDAAPKVESVGLVVDGNALAVASMAGASSGTADVKVDGSTYTITGEAVGADMKNPMAGMITKKFEIKVDCN